MRKLAAIFLLAVFSFNIAGYQVLYNYMANRSDASLESALDQNNYKEEDLITIKQPTNLPYYNSSNEFQRVDGEVEIGGVKYKYVKCRINNGFLEMLCIPNKAKMQIEQDKNEYAKVSNDFLQNDTQKKSNAPVKSFQKSLSEYEEQSMVQNDFKRSLSTFYVLVNSVFEENHFFTTVEQPPDAAQS